MSSIAINTCKLKGLEAEFNADCKKRAAEANIRIAAGKSRRGGHAKVYHSSPRAPPRGRSLVGARAGRSAGKRHRARPLRRPTRRHALEHRHQISEGSMAMAGNLANEPGADQEPAPDLPR